MHLLSLHSKGGRIVLQQVIILLTGLFIAITESLQQETAMFGIKSIVIEPGNFATEVLETTNIKYETPTIAEYSPLHQGLKAAIEGSRTQMRGDPRKVVERIIDVVKSEGMASGKTMPIRLPLGPDALASIRAKCKTTLEICDEWEEVISSTNGVAPENGVPHENDKAQVNDKP